MSNGPKKRVGGFDDVVSKYKGTLILGEPAIEVLSLVVSALRKSKDPANQKVDQNDTRDVLNALTISGYAVIPQGTIEAIKRLLTETQPLLHAQAEELNNR